MKSHSTLTLVACAVAVSGCAKAGSDAPIDSPANIDAAIQDGPRLDGPPDASARMDARMIDAMVDAPRDAPAASCTMAFTGVLASWSFTGQPGNQASTAAGSAAPGVTAGAISRASALTAVSGSGSINSSNWATGSTRDSAKYYTFTVEPPADCKLDVTGLSIVTSKSATGPASAEVATSADSFVSTVAISSSGTSTPTLAVTDEASTVELRVYGFAAGSTAGTMRVESTLSVSGKLH